MKEKLKLSEELEHILRNFSYPTQGELRKLAREAKAEGLAEVEVEQSFGDRHRIHK